MPYQPLVACTCNAIVSTTPVPPVLHRHLLAGCERLAPSSCIPRAAFCRACSSLCAYRVRRREGLTSPPPKAHARALSSLPKSEHPSPLNHHHHHWRTLQPPGTSRDLRRTAAAPSPAQHSLSVPALGASGCCCNAALYSSSHPFQPSYYRFREGTTRRVNLRALGRGSQPGDLCLY